jgi:hypothetical protein
MKADKGKDKMISALEKYKGIVSYAVKAVGINRSTHYRWMKEDEVYKAAVEDITEVTLDYVEQKLIDQIDDDHPASIMFYLKSKGKKRGYGQSVELTGDAEKPIQWIEQKTYDEDKDN